MKKIIDFFKKFKTQIKISIGFIFTVLGSILLYIFNKDKLLGDEKIKTKYDSIKKEEKEVKENVKKIKNNRDSIINDINNITNKLTGD